ncbi:endolytic transglycosylase MltG [Candidatus Daviesbacteria bacterium]|nr:endolytic transglycosylase MltG [Candidatus Daviesbacteria bacterium]
MRQSKNNFLRNWLILIVFLGAIFLIGKGFLNFLNSPVDASPNFKALVVKKGDGLTTVAENLKQQNLIRSALAFKISYKFFTEDPQIQAGDFKLSASMSTPEIIKVLKSGSVDRWVTLIEGWRVEEMAAKLNDELGIKSEDFLKEAKEGYMFPDTYLFNPQASAAIVASIMEDNFNQKYSADLKNQIGKLGLTPDQGIILASIVEREARSDGVRTKVASILLKRLKIGMGLDADATVQYALGYQSQEKNWWKRNLTEEDLQTKSPYNTYLHSGLPPGPICNPSLSSIKAVANADPTTDYLYYYHDSKGNSYYAKTLEEHNKNVAEHP